MSDAPRDLRIYTWSNHGAPVVSVVAHSLEQAQQMVIKHGLASQWWLTNHPPRVRSVDTVGVIASKKIKRWILDDDD